MTDIVGIIPSAGRASRIGGFFKELTPINVNPDDSAKFIVVSERIIWQMSRAGAAPLYLVVSEEKSSIISGFYGGTKLFSKKRAFLKLQGSVDKMYGMPFAIDSVYEDTRGKTVLLGMPDTLIEPDDAFAILLTRFKQHQSDLELGLFTTRPDNFGGFVTFDQDSARVTSHIDKTSPGFDKNRANNAWAIACWNGRFTEFMHGCVVKRQLQHSNGEVNSSAELLFGDIIDAALQDGSLRMCASFVSEESGYYLDITDPAKYFQAVLHYHKVPVGLASKATSTPTRSDSRKPTVFISHASRQKDRAHDLHAMLEKSGYKPILDSYEIRPGQQFPARIQTLIAEADFFVLLLSRASIASKWVVAEVAFAAAHGFLEQGRLLPVAIETIPDDEADSMPMISRSTCHWLNATSGGLSHPVLKWLQKHPNPTAKQA